MQKNALVIVADGFEEIEAISCIDILRRAGIEVVVAGLTGVSITGAHGITVVADTVIAQVTPDFAALVLPGGMPGATHLAASDKVRSLIMAMHRQGKIIAAICAAPAIVLAPLGILDNKTATCFTGMEKEFHPSTTFSRDNVVVDGAVITSRGAGTAAFFALAIVGQLVGKTIAAGLKSRMLIS